MGLLMAFAPFATFAVVDRLVGTTEGLFAGAVFSIFLLVREFVAGRRSPKILEVGSAVLFGGLALYSILSASNWSIIGVRLLVDAGLLIIVLLSIALRRPFTLQYAHEQVSPEYWNDERFKRTNYIISAAWALAFAVVVIADLVLLYVPEWPPRYGIILIVIALVGAFKFTNWYPEQQRG
jgi:hypothetical protein